MRKNAELFTLILATIVSLMACHKDSLSRKTKGEGYIFGGIKDKPVKEATVKVISTTQGKNIKVSYTDTTPLCDAYMRQVEETFTTDESGYFQISFPKRLECKISQNNVNMKKIMYFSNRTQFREK